MGTGTFTSVFALPEFASHFDDPHLVREKDRVLLFYAGLDPASIEVTCDGNLVRVKAKTHQKFGGGDFETSFWTKDAPVTVEYDMGVIVLRFDNKSPTVLKITGK